ncbi:MAG: urea ABC transporter permease subunit UrtB [Nitrospiraceae bacterium]|nr:urea ABC transporter permease subunit UrtB [Nitrospiraceae bacterium]
MRVRGMGLRLVLCTWVWLFTGAVGWAAEQVESLLSPATLEEAFTGLRAEAEGRREAAVAFLIEQGDLSLLPRLDEIRADADRSLRQALKPIADAWKHRANLGSADPDVRRSAAVDLGMSGRRTAIPWLEAAVIKESHRWVRYSMEEAIQLLKLASGNPAVRLTAVARLGDLRSQNAVPMLKELVHAAGEPGAGEKEQSLGRAATAAIDQIETWGDWATAFETLFRGLSLSSILLIMSLGLAIVFGLMGVINMAHGELIMIGAYATFLVQQAFKAWFPEGWFDGYYLAALPASFLAAALCGLVLEWTVIRFLYGRPLETMLATWGVSLIMIQAARVAFGDLTAVAAPGWLSGGIQAMVGVYLPFNRLFILGLSIVCVTGIYLLLFRSSLGLRIRAVTQNRSMSACLGIPTRAVDAYTFAFGSGLAGVAGWALTLVGNVEPGLGQNYIVDSFMVVVTGGVGKLAGTIIASLGIGGLNKLLEPSLGAVFGKVIILMLVILFLQRRPSGLFAVKGRHADA